MEMKQDKVRVYVLPDGAYCDADERKRSPLDVEKCPMGYEECDGDCFYYSE